MRHSILLSALSRSFLAGEPTVDAIIVRARRTLGREWPWIRPLAQRYAELTAGRTRPRQRDVVQLFREYPSLHDVRYRLSVEHWLAEPQQMQPVSAAQAWNLPPITSTSALAEWLEIAPAELDWFADLRGLGYKGSNPLLRH